LVARRARRPRPMIALPGLGASDRSTVPLRTYLAHIGHRPHGWGLGVNTGDLATIVPRFLERLGDVAARTGNPVALAGWSLGGIVAREAARARPDLVAMVISFGSPLQGPRFTTAADGYSPDELRRIDEVVARRQQRPITVPVTAIYSKNDAIVDWRSCLDRITPGARNVEVTSSHLGMGLDPDVWTAVADALDG
jgi:pimeloyl-ACP methyl ester carboxylesterase